jgi:hypothetical protein
MPAQAIAFPEWQPDLANNVFTKAVNVRAIANGYAPVKAPQAVTVALAAAFNGGGAFIGSDGGSTLLAATGSNVYKYTGTAWSSVLAATANQVVRFAQFGDNILIANGGTLKSYGLISGAVTTPTDAPSAIDVAQVRDFVMAITPDNKVQWCQFNNSSVWTGGVNQADNQPTLSSQAVRLIGGEYGILLKRQGILRLTYVGSSGGIIFQFDEISAETGCMAANSVCNVGRLIFFLSERGFMMCDGSEVLPIADEKFNRWFFNAYSRQEIGNIWAAIDPRYSLALWAMPGTPGRIIAYNWVLKRATTFETNISGLMTGYTAGISLDALDAVYGNLDAIPISLDDPSLAGGNPILLLADSSNILNALTGDNLQAVLRLENIEPSPGRRSRIRSLRLISDTLDASATVDARMRSGDTEFIRASSSMRSNGKLPIRSNGRYNTLEVTIPPTGWGFIQGCEFEFEAGDGR